MHAVVLGQQLVHLQRIAVHHAGLEPLRPLGGRPVHEALRLGAAAVELFGAEAVHQDVRDAPVLVGRHLAVGGEDDPKPRGVRRRTVRGVDDGEPAEHGLDDLGEVGPGVVRVERHAGA
ncbi:hypothetical protein [Cellulosimicrobium sp. KWT-B]|uniref:hypothetical protein n=1 Tax=Cellulosimicrobium sp. KWT-B TaxID=1981152 RepID=UPI00117755FC|nr:hypothetical protein [Cellulosimicrobium sp. KWT-B]